MFCKNCGEALNENQAICLKCGVQVGNGNTHCANCGNTIDPNATFCTSCGAANKAPAAKGGDLGGKDKITIALVCFFLGGLGIHNFMMGESKKGIFRLVLSIVGCGIGGIFALIDFIKILTDKYEVDPNKLI